MIKVETDHFNLGQICQSGQCFRMERIEESRDGAEAGTESGKESDTENDKKNDTRNRTENNKENDAGNRTENDTEDSALPRGDRYRVIAGGRYLEIIEGEEGCYFLCSQEECDAHWKAYFDLETDYGQYIRQIDPGDAYLVRAAASGSGIRILRQDLWETIVSFLISQQNNILRIRRCIRTICEGYGERLETPHGVGYHAFPTPQALAGLEEDGLLASGLGYRSKYVVRAARCAASGELDLEGIKALPYREAKEELLKLFGVGEKVADCICLFALHHLEAFPVDTHISQVLQAHYKKGFPKRRYKGYQGVLQQYIFYHTLHADGP